LTGYITGDYNKSRDTIWKIISEKIGCLVSQLKSLFLMVIFASLDHQPKEKGRHQYQYRHQFDKK
jgi:hypothetical protein